MSRDIQVNFRSFQAYALSGEAAGSEREEKVAFFRELLSGQDIASPRKGYLGS